MFTKNTQLFFHCIVSLCCISIVSAAHAHGDLHERIVKVTEEIKVHRDSAYLYVKRGELYYQHEEHKKALKDFAKAEKLGYSDLRLSYDSALALYRLRRSEAALQKIDAILAKAPDHVKAHRLKGQIHSETGDDERAAMSFERVIELASSRLPENYLDAAFAWMNTGTTAGRQKAIATVEKGILDLGPILTLLDGMVSICLENHDFDCAIKYQSEIIAQLERKEWALYERAVIYVQANHNEKAKRDLQAAEEAIGQLPVRLQQQTNTIELRNKIQVLQQSLAEMNESKN